MALRCSDWSGLLTADDFTDRRVEDLEAMSERRIVEAIQQMTSGGMQGIDPTWVEFLREHMQVAAFVAEGTRRALERAATLCTDPGAARCLAVQTMMYERQAQSVVLYAMDLSRQLGDIPIEDARAAWETGSAWASAREHLAAVGRCDDWGEIVVALNLCFEPLAGQYLRREFAKAALSANDTVTPIVSGAGQVEWDWVQRWTAALVSGLIEDPVHGAANGEVLQAWVAEHTPSALGAARGMRELGAGSQWEPALDDGLKAVCADQGALLTQAGLEPGTSS
ncbi:MAG: alkene monooxygenase beta subunit [Solirubrobacteraceae bacterium]|nr:alkene monooxygenase beta subunit [Solirubrobacteraceae bacterium]